MSGDQSDSQETTPRKRGQKAAGAKPAAPPRFVDVTEQKRMQEALAASERRCALTGRPGVPDHAGWYLILSREAILWRATQPDAFRGAIYPQRPDPSPGPEPV